MTGPDDEPTRAAVTAALAVASVEGLRVAEPRIVGRGSNRIVWLWPAPIVARVMTGTVVLHTDPAGWLAREIDVCRFLADSGAPVVSPANSVDPGPHRRDGLWLSLWDYAEVIPADLSPVEIGKSLRLLHDAMASYPGALPPRAAVLVEIDWLLGTVANHPDHAKLVSERDRLAPRLSQDDAGGQPLHGDASLSNLLSTSAGARWNDFEDVCFGSPTWDIVSLLDDAREARGEAFASALLAAYGRDLDPTITQLVRDTLALYGTLWQRYTGRAPAPAL